jgi:hypothetical protein
MQQQRHHFTQSAPLELRMAEQAKQLRKEAQGTPPGVKRNDVNEYRAFLIGHDGHIRSSRAFVCGDDADAIVWAEQLVDGHDIELWSGERFVRRVNAAVTKKDNLSTEQPADAKPSREKKARQVAQEYADDQREIIKKLRNPTD